MEKIILPGGVRLLAERVPHVRTAALGIWIGSGTRHEPPGYGGISHALEHMVFKGAGPRSAVLLAEDMDAIGGQVNAYTTKENTTFYVKTLDRHLEIASEVLSDLYFSPHLRASDWRTERAVIAEEIDMYEDTPEDLVTERLFASTLSGGLERSILGTRGSLSRITAKTLQSYRARHYTPQATVVSLAGSFTDKDLQRLADRFSNHAVLDVAPPPPDEAAAAYTPALLVRKKPIEQSHLCLAFPGLPMASDKRYIYQVMSGILGGGMSSRLFQTLREERGLCYSVYSFAASHQDTGLFGVYLALNKRAQRQALETAMGELRRFAADGPTPEELTRAVEQNMAGVLMGLESTTARMSFLGRGELLIGDIPSYDEIVERYAAVTRQDVHDLAAEVLDFDRMSLSAVGDVSPARVYKEILGM